MTVAESTVTSPGPGAAASSSVRPGRVTSQNGVGPAIPSSWRGTAWVSWVGSSTGARSRVAVAQPWVRR